MSNLGFAIWNETWANSFLATVIEGIAVDYLWPDYQFSNQAPAGAPQTAFWINHLYSTRNLRASQNKRTFVLSRFGGLGSYVMCLWLCVCFGWVRVYMLCCFRSF